MSQQERWLKSYEFRADLVKQLLTLSTAVIALSATFAKDIVGKPSTATTWWLCISWVLLVFSVIFGLLCLSSLSTNLVDSADDIAAFPSASSENTITVLQMQFLLFLLGLIALCAFGLSGVRQPQEPATDKPTINNSYQWNTHAAKAEVSKPATPIELGRKKKPKEPKPKTSEQPLGS